MSAPSTAAPKLARDRREASRRALLFAKKLGLRVGLVLVLALGLALATGRIDTRPLRHLRAALLTGPEQGNYAALGAKLRAVASQGGGELELVPSAGSAENLERLARAPREGCRPELGLVQAGLPLTGEGEGELVTLGRLPKQESLFLFGKNADALGSLADLRGLRVSIGPEGSGTARLVREVFGLRDLEGLGVVLEARPIDEGLALAREGKVDLAAVVIDEDADLVQRVVRDDGLAIAGLAQLDVVARRFPHLRVGRIGAGQYDAVRLLPKVDKRVLRVETHVLANACASRSELMAMLEVLDETFPGFSEHNRVEREVGKGAPKLSAVTRDYLKNPGPDYADKWLPWAVDLMPPGNWMYLVMGVSVLFNVMGVAHRFRLWRIDAARVKTEQDLTALFGRPVTVGEIERWEAAGDVLSPGFAHDLEAVVSDLEALAERCRSQSLSVIAPMGQEMVYRYQETLMHDLLAALRALRARREVAVLHGAEPRSEAPRREGPEHEEAPGSVGPSASS